jgi:hypothetical protein
MYKFSYKNKNSNESITRKVKTCQIATPDVLSAFLFNIFNKNLSKDDLIFDPCVGKGNILKP